MNHETETLLPEPERTPSGREGSSLVAVLGSRIGIRNQRGGPRPGQIRPFYVRKTPQGRFPGNGAVWGHSGRREADPGWNGIMTTRTNRIDDIFQDARGLQADALEMLAQGRVRNAAEKVWGAMKRATKASILSRTGV